MLARQIFLLWNHLRNVSGSASQLKQLCLPPSWRHRRQSPPVPQCWPCAKTHDSWASKNETPDETAMKNILLASVESKKHAVRFFLLGFLGISWQDLSSLAHILSCVSGNLSCATRFATPGEMWKRKDNREPMQSPGATAARFFPIALQNSHEEGIRRIYEPVWNLYGICVKQISGWKTPTVVIDFLWKCHFESLSGQQTSCIVYISRSCNAFVLVCHVCSSILGLILPCSCTVLNFRPDTRTSQRGKTQRIWMEAWV